RLNFGNSLKNTPTGFNLGSFGGLLERPGSVVGIKDCDHWKLYVTSLTKPNMIELDYSAGLGNNPSAKNLGNVNGGSVSGGNSNFIFYNGEKYVFYVNTISNNLSRTVFPKCSDIGIGPFTQFTPPTFSFPQSGVYQISYIANEGTPTEQNYCKSIVVLDGTNINIGNDTTYCGNFSRVLTTGIPNTLWSTGQTGSSITVLQPGTYWAEVNQPCGKIRDSIVIGLNQSIQINIGNDTTYCGNFSRVLTTGIPSTLWSTGQTGSSITVSQPGTYWAEVTNSCGAFRDSIIINLDESVSFYLGNDTVICGNFSKTLITGLSNTIWSTGESGSQIIVGQLGTYWAEVTGDCGVYRDTIVISDKNCGCGTIEFPNAFSPNVDQVNDIFKPLYACKITYFRFMVFNRWGEKVFETNNPKEGWDGKYQGEMTPLDSYAWYCEYTYESEDKVNKAKGMVTIIR
ncbi:MAG: gliding motility-associated C-terminal domain-containing protein, partial [Chitinophagales bacterium]|nr:gliding motility-associated C-terminal domain-containing protein [Chitinophagales bacterium]